MNTSTLAMYEAICCQFGSAGRICFWQFVGRTRHSKTLEGAANAIERLARSKRWQTANVDWQAIASELSHA